MSTAIEWTDETWNPVRGCSRVSEGCRHCYAERIAARFSGAGMAYEGLARRTSSGEARWTGEVRLLPEKLDEPLRWRKPRRVFVNSMSDLFHPDVPERFIADVFSTMIAATRHTFQVLTKRPERMADVVDRLARGFGPGGSIYVDGCYIPPPNVWLGTSVEHQEAADERIPHLLDTPASVRFLSCEPLLDDLDIRRWLGGTDIVREHGSRGKVVSRPRNGIDWVIVGGESGPGARPMRPEWARSIRDQCAAPGVAFFFKQWGGPTPKSGGRLLDGREYNAMPGVPTPEKNPHRDLPLFANGDSPRRAGGGT